VRELQQGLDYTFKHWAVDRRVRIDGIYGRQTKSSVMLATFILGFAERRRKMIRHAGLDERTQQIIRGSRHRTRFMRLRTRLRRRRIRKLRQQYNPSKPPGSLGAWDGRKVAGWMVGLYPGPDGKRRNWLAAIKETGHWSGDLYSGFRDPAYSESLCYGICGAPSCPGLCAGRASNHSQTGAPNWGAIDVMNPDGFQRGANQVGAPFTNHLPYDPNHRSYTGY
jgi:hypothetical protein